MDLDFDNLLAIGASATALVAGATYIFVSQNFLLTKLILILTNYIFAFIPCSVSRVATKVLQKSLPKKSLLARQQIWSLAK